ncbi:MliC family protein [Rheinheimera sp. WS51]|uniref:MliC family protein n=1 Tax=Rheinheimera sp. WS51 TaxID=3425886 RepID=UPI003D8BE3F4
MKITLPLLVVSAFLMTACDSTVLDKQKPQAVTDKAQHYQCESGEVILASYISTDEASLVYKDTTYKMTIETSASGARYVSHRW